MKNLFPKYGSTKSDDQEQGTSSEDLTSPLYHNDIPANSGLGTVDENEDDNNSNSNSNNENDDKQFKLQNLYYVKQSKWTQETWIATIFPLVIAAAIIFVSIYYVVHAVFASSGSPTPTTTTTVYSTPTSAPAWSAVDVPTLPPKSGHSSSAYASAPTSSSCALNPRCEVLGLTGECCPTPDGISLDCCD